MSITFPTRPVQEQTFTFGSRTWKWNGFAWDAVLDIPTGGGPGLTGEPGTALDRELYSDHFYPINEQDRTGQGRKVLVLNDDGSYGFEYILFQDVFKNTDFNISIRNFKLNGNVTNYALIGNSNNIDYDLTGNFTVEYPSPIENTISAKISGPFIGSSEYNLQSPFTELQAFGKSISYPSSSDGVKTFTITATGDKGNVAVNTCKIVFPNYLYWGISTIEGVDASNIEDLGNADLRTGNQLRSSFIITFNVPNETDFLWLAFPSKHGRIIAVADVVGGQDKTNEFPTNPPQMHTNNLGYQENYYIYRMSQPGGGTFSYQFTVG